MNDNQSGLAEALAAAGLVSGDVSDRARQSRARFLHRHADAVYDALTGDRSRFVRINELVEAAARQFPGLVPTAQAIAAEEGLRQSQKAGLEIDQGLFLSAILGSRQSGPHLCHAMLLPKPEAQALLPKFVKDDVIDTARRFDRAARQGRDGDVPQSALPQRRGSDHARRHGDLRRSCLARPADRGRCAARHGGRASEVQGPARVRRRHQSDASLSRADSVPLVSGARPRLREQALSWPGAARWARRRTSSAGRPSRSPGSRRWKPSPSAAIARSCWRSTTCWRSRMRS